MKILMLTSVYKDQSLGNKDTSTNIVNSFVKEWKKQGHEVIVVHNSHCYPRFIHEIPANLKKSLAVKMGFAISDYNAVMTKEYLDNGVKVFRLPIKKYIPHSQPTKGAITKQVSKIVTILRKENFNPDIITGHWASPQMEIISELKKVYNCKTAVVLHGTGYINSKKFNATKYLKNIDYLGARSLSQAKQIKDILQLKKLPFVCYSGVPDEYLKEYKLNLDKYKNIKTWEITYVGRLVSYKNIDATINALSKIQDVNWRFNIVGDGASRTELEELVRKLNLTEKVHFLGRVSREQVMKILKDTHIFVMISTNEIFGLVYLEAMAASCLTIASKNGGVDGIIKCEKNGFLCEEGNNIELHSILNRIIKKEVNEISNIVEMGYKTAREYSDSEAARVYIKNITL
ncbi:glycosyltransferase [Catenibacterium mitsuokai]|uniref:glycosyltransferase n=1 Tax=Catenibacterium mitsuokai TaxID=100886 RepID=UPI001C2430B7|nr:glycosyltransferase [Catenibacterium mitsuokai]MBU9056269.1 glycosyltransferase [Catenibacterium mitsuokai]MCB5427020.1 glycosyltransferase [Catenibacterium mitsuokai]